MSETSSWGCTGALSWRQTLLRAPQDFPANDLQRSQQDQSGCAPIARKLVVGGPFQVSLSGRVSGALVAPAGRAGLEPVTASVSGLLGEQGAATIVLYLAVSLGFQRSW